MQYLQMKRSEEEQMELMRRSEETEHILEEIETLKEQVLQQPNATSNPAIIGHYPYPLLHSMLRT